MRHIALVLLTVVAVALAAARPPPTCGASCAVISDCIEAADGCTLCREGKCTAQCGAHCTSDADCGLSPGAPAGALGNNSECFVCYFNQCASQYCGAQCTSDSQCQANPLCKVCVQGACNPPPTPQPSVPPTPAPPTPPPTPAPGKAAWGSMCCGADNCGTMSYFNFGVSAEQAQTIACETTPTQNGQPYVYATWTQPLPCAALVLDGSFDAFFVNSTDQGSATTQAMEQCRSAGHQTCFLSFAACAEYPPKGSTWGGIATQGSPESLQAIQLNTNKGAGYSTWEEAMNVTMNDCNNNYGSCGLTAVWYNCMAFANNPEQAASVNFANSLEAAKQAALTSCTFEAEGDGGCTVASAACIDPYHSSNDHTVTGGRTWRFSKSEKKWLPGKVRSQIHP